jgi:hypothetical protein
MWRSGIKWIQRGEKWMIVGINQLKSGQVPIIADFGGLALNLPGCGVSPRRLSKSQKTLITPL